MSKVARDEKPSSEEQAALASTAQQVSQLYGFLAGLYRSELTSQQLNELLQPDMLAMLTDAGIGLQGAFWTQSEDQLLEDLAVEFTTLFLGPGGHISPHESVQVEQGGYYWGDATAAVRSFIVSTGIEYAPGYNGIPDHISVELEFLSELSRREAIAWENGDAADAGNCLAYQRDFLNEHLGRWVERFCSRVVERAELSFYRDVAQVTVDFVNSEITAVHERIEAAEGHVPQIPVNDPGLANSGCELNATT